MIARLRSFTSHLVGTVLMCVALPSLTWALPINSHYLVSPASCQPSGSSLNGASAATSASRLELMVVLQIGTWMFLCLFLTV